MAGSTSKGASTAGRKVSKRGQGTRHFVPSGWGRGGVTWLTQLASVTGPFSPEQRAPAHAPLSPMR